MTKRISDADILKVRETPIVDLISKHVVLDRRDDNGEILDGPCPFDQDERSELLVHPGRNVYACSSCSASGDVINFAQRIGGISFADAVRQVAEANGIQLSP